MPHLMHAHKSITTLQVSSRTARTDHDFFFFEATVVLAQTDVSGSTFVCCCFRSGL